MGHLSTPLLMSCPSVYSYMYVGVKRMVVPNFFHFFSFFSLYFHSISYHMPFWPCCPILPPPMGDPTPSPPLSITFRSDEPIWPKETIPKGIFRRFLEKNFCVVKFPIFAHVGVRTPPLASSTKHLTISRSSFGVFLSATDGGAWPDKDNPMTWARFWFTPVHPLMNVVANNNGQFW